MVAGRSILIFIKAPVAGFVKTRLTPDLTPAQAAELYKAIAQDTYTVACQMPDANITVAYEPHKEFPEPGWITAPHPHPQPLSLIRERVAEGRVRVGLNWFPQAGKDLGERMGNAVETVFAKNPGPLVVIGSDLPSLTPVLLEKAFGLLRVAPVVLGPSADGGYYLIGLRESQSAVFQGIHWSQPTVLGQSIEKLKTLRCDYKLLPRRLDVDTADDLRRVRADPALVAVEFRRTMAVLRDLKR